MCVATERGGDKADFRSLRLANELTHSARLVVGSQRRLCPPRPHPGLLVGDAPGSPSGHWREHPVECESPLATGGQTPSTTYTRPGWSRTTLCPRWGGSCRISWVGQWPPVCSPFPLLSPGSGADSPALAQGQARNILQCLGFC